MNVSKILYWFVFLCIFLLASYLSITGRQVSAFIIFFVLGMFHAIIFHLAEKSFLEIRSKIKEVISLISEGIYAVWKDKLIIIYAFIAIFSVISIILLYFFFFLKKLVCAPMAVFKTLRRL
ncbi:MAG: hypothetical protein ACE5F2_01505 [Candidatus Paceibacteria bacterium]